MKELHVLPSSNFLTFLQTQVRNRWESADDFVFYFDRLCDILMQFVLSLLPYEPHSVDTYVNSKFNGLKFSGVCCLTVVRRGIPLENSLRRHLEDVAVGKVVIRQAANREPRLFYFSFPEIMNQTETILLLDSVIASANAIIMALHLLLDHGVQIQKIVVVCVVISPQGISSIRKLFPGLRIVTASVEEGLDTNYLLVPGMGSIGKRYFDGK